MSTPDAATSVVALPDTQPFAHHDGPWWGYRITVPDAPTIDVWVLNARVEPDGEGGLDTEYTDIRLSDGSSANDCENPHPDFYCDELHRAIWNDVVNGY